MYLSPTNVEDGEIYTKWLNDFKVTDYIGKSSVVCTLEAEKKWLEENNQRQNKIVFAIIDKEKDELIGNCGLYEINTVSRTATLGIFIGEEEGRNKGYGTEVVGLLLDYGFSYLNLHEINLDVIAFNQRAIRCYQKCGFKEYGRRRESYFLNGKYHDIISMDILKNEFQKSYILNKNK